ncbi:serine/threonine-protein kinase, partial [Dokdonella sp.]|uniref:serine/threonine-protein kinase n=1 Tax=Dokdonella sp. TaxID=2291710 RepID=UPI00262A609F
MDKFEASSASTGPSTVQTSRAPDAIEPDRWQRLQQLFDGLAACAPAERAAWLAAQADDGSLKREALRLVDADERGDDVIGPLCALITAPLPRGGRRLGAWRLREEIGNGSMGTVFLAERTDDAFDQRVAIKLLRGIPTRESTERMRRERQILADLAHPHIARLLDGGSTADGQPYLVMEHVDGVPLDQFCRRRSPALPERLRLVQKLCAAVQYAHQRLVIHRDLKPANVLVRADGEPVLLDFGIAKLLGDTSVPSQQTGVPWFTPAYASPEQLKRERVGTAADVYALGALLYEVLTDTTPAPDAEGRLPPPSRASGLAVDRELDLIVAKATHPEQERRYASAAALAEDLQRYLRGRPVHAAPDSLRYRVAKFVGRHRLACAATAVALAVAALFAWQLARERDRALHAEADARRQTETTENVVSYLVSLFRSAAPDEAGNRPIAPRDLVDRARREIDSRLSDAPRQRARLLASLGRIYLELGLIDESHEAL